MDRRPNASENADHQSGKIAMLNMYNATERLVIVGEVFRSTATCPSEAAARALVDILGPLACVTGELTKEDTAAHRSSRGSKRHYKSDEPFQLVAVIIWVLDLSYKTESSEQSSSPRAWDLDCISSRCSDSGDCSISMFEVLVVCYDGGRAG